MILSKKKQGLFFIINRAFSSVCTGIRCRQSLHTISHRVEKYSDSWDKKPCDLSQYSNTPVFRRFIWIWQPAAKKNTFVYLMLQH